MGFVKSVEEIVLHDQPNAVFNNAEMLNVFFMTRPDIVKRLLPAPLKPAMLPIASAFIANYPRTNFGVSYLEGALFLTAEYNGIEGNYCLAMPVTNDMALILGREVFGYPKKMANISFERNGDLIEGWTERHGTRFLEVKARMTGKFNDEAAQHRMMEKMAAQMDIVVYNFKYFQAPEKNGFDYNPRLIREIVQLRPDSIKMGEAELTFRSSAHDYWGDVEIVRVLGAVYMVGTNTILPGSVVAEAEPLSFEPYSLMKVDALRPV